MTNSFSGAHPFRPQCLLDVAERVNGWMKHARPAIFADGKLIDEDGAHEVKFRPHPGGWAEFGYDDGDDNAERTR